MEIVDSHFELAISGEGQTHRLMSRHKKEMSRLDELTCMFSFWRTRISQNVVVNAKKSRPQWENGGAVLRFPRLERLIPAEAAAAVDR